MPNECYFVVGCIYHNGHVRYRACYEGDSIEHTDAESNGKRWRWDVTEQRFDFFTLNSAKNDFSTEMTEEEILIVVDNLVKNGFADQGTWDRYNQLKEWEDAEKL